MTGFGETSGTSIFMIGGVVVALFAVSGASLVNQRFQESKSYREVERSLIFGINEIEELQHYRASLLQRVKSVDAIHLSSSRQMNQIQLQLTKIDQQRTILNDRCSLLRYQLKDLLTEFAAYQKQSRLSAWFRSEGELLGDLKTLDGRILHQATISKVMPFGLEIRHRDGFSRVTITELDASLRERFRWEEFPITSTLSFD